MRLLYSLAILGVLLIAGFPSARAAEVSDWPSLGADAAQSNNNASEKTLTAKNVMKLKVKWTAAVPDVSYPVIAGGNVYVPQQKGKAIHVQVLDALTGKQVAKFTKSAVGGLLVSGGKLYLAGHTLQVLDPETGEVQSTIKGPSTSSQATFAYPVADARVILAGYSSASASVPNSVYAIDPSTNAVLWHSPSQNAQGAIAAGRVLTLTATGTVSYGEMTGKAVATQASLLGDWFSTGALAFTVASTSNHKTTILAYDSSGKKAWSRAVGPLMDPRGWAHAATTQGIYVAMLKPYEGLEALDPSNGSVVWQAKLKGIQRLAVANGVVFALTNELGLPLKLVMYHADTGKPIGSLSLSSGYYAFPTNNELMVADGMVFARVVGPAGPALVALGL